MTALPPQTGVERMLTVIARLRGEGGCPWDRKQTLDTLKHYVVEEAYELIDAIESEDVGQHRDELGDVLLQVVLQSRIREERGDFAFDDVAAHLAEKLVRRHPHVFGDAVAETAEDVVQRWEQVKADERKAAGSPASAVDGVPRHLPSLQKAHRVQSRAARVGFDWDDVSNVICKVEEELAETRETLAAGDPARLKEEIGDLLFAVVNLSRFQQINAEEALDRAVAKFVRRFQAVEQRIHAGGRTLDECTLAELDAEWDTVKATERSAI